MTRFTKNIDLKLIELADSLKAKVSINRPDYSESLRTFEERRIDWTDGGINKAIILQPNFEATGVNEEKWNFSIAAWYFGDTADLRFSEDFLHEKQFNTIANQLDDLLAGG
jgi:hypothetical protein